MFPKVSASAFSLVGLFYFFGHLFGHNYLHNWHHDSKIKFVLTFGTLAIVCIAILEYLYVNRLSTLEKGKKIMKIQSPDLKIVKTAKTISPEIRMVYDAGFNNNDIEQFSNVQLEHKNEKEKNST